MQSIIFLILGLYLLLLLKYTIGWYKTQKKEDIDFVPKVSVVIALRNEEHHVERLLKALQSLIYPHNKIEFILVNDHSSDNTFELLQEAVINNLVLINMKAEEGKKKAILKAVTVARGEIIITTDADCIFCPNWVQTLVSYFSNDNIKLVSAPVTYEKQANIFQKLQALEFTSLIASGAGAIGSGSPIFCNGANMAFRKDVFLEVNDFSNDSAISGDDVFLLHSVKQRYTNAIVFAKDEKAIVLTKGTQSIYEFINQRKRWTAKSVNYRDIGTIYASFLVLLTNISLIYLFFNSIADISKLHIFGLFYIAKSVVDVLLLYPVLKFFKRIDLVKWILPFEFFYSFFQHIVIES